LRLQHTALHKLNGAALLFQLRLQHTALHKLNGAALLVTFLLCRVLLFPYLYWAYGRHRGLPLWGVPASLPPLYNGAAAALLAPQLYWFGLICRRAWRTCRGPGGRGGAGGGARAGGGKPP
ncbi:ceramide synthase-like, partial [Myiozetetes cayanensis]|uniref:ceramide synthase-like n=1 Tax=Myiozetetes cayanensis TaxID=478635 RepID=UPI00216088CF